jgi:transcriptional regulator with XRE-family HTH domain
VKPLAAKLNLVLKAISISRARLASSLGVDKSAVSRWLTGAVTPSAENLARITALVAERAPGFTLLDWERDLASLADALGVNPSSAVRAPAQFGDGLPLDCLASSLTTTALRGAAYEGFFRSTRPYAQRPGHFIHDHVMVRRDANGLLRLSQRTAGVAVEGWLLLLENQLFFVGTELTSGAAAFGILNGVNSVQAGAIEGILLTCALDSGRTPTAMAAVFERIGDLSGDPAADEAHLAALDSGDPMAPPGSVPDEIQRHLTRDFGPAQLQAGGDWLLRLPIARTLSRGLL